MLSPTQCPWGVNAAETGGTQIMFSNRERTALTGIQSIKTKALEFSQPYSLPGFYLSHSQSNPSFFLSELTISLVLVFFSMAPGLPLFLFCTFKLLLNWLALSPEGNTFLAISFLNLKAP